LERPDLMWASPLGRAARVVNMSQLGHALTELGVAGTDDKDGKNIDADNSATEEPPAKEPPVMALFVYNSNPAAIAPNQSAVVRGLARSDLFTVVHELFFSDTTDYADFILPATTFLEDKDIQGTYGHYYVQLSEQAIAPLGEARSNVWLFGQLAQRMGFPEPCFREAADDLIAQALSTADGGGPDPWMRGITPERLQRERRVRLQFESEREGKPFLPFSTGGFGTPSGKIEFFSETLASQGFDAMPAFHPPVESRNGEGNRYPLEFLPRKADNFMNSTFANLPGHREMESATRGVLEMDSSDAAARQISEGDWVAVYNDRGRIPLRAHINGKVARGVVAASLDWNKLSSGGSNVNALTSERLTDMGGGPTFYSTLVEVQKLADGAQKPFTPID
jgi:anaerobic selenocysteine-containing dehydrogenase